MIVTTSDEPFLGEAEALIKSCARSAPEQSFCLYLVNAESVPDFFQRWHPNMIVARAYWRDVATPLGDRMLYARAPGMLHVLERYEEPTLYLDSDILVRGNLRELFSLLETFDLLVRYRPQLEHRGILGTLHASKFNGGVIAVSNRSAGVSFARRYYDTLTDRISPLGVAADEVGGRGRRASCSGPRGALFDLSVDEG